MRYVDCYRILDLLPNAYPRKARLLEILTGNPEMAGQQSRMAFMAQVDAEWQAELKEIRSLQVEPHDESYLEYHQIRRERGEIEAYYWIGGQRERLAGLNAQIAAERRNAEIVQQIWLSVNALAHESGLV